MDQPSDRLVNMVGALALALADRVRDAAVQESALSSETAAALAVIDHAPGLSIEQLRHVLGLSHPGTARLVERLVSAELATREPTADDRRVMALRLTPSGRSRLEAVHRRRDGVLARSLEAVAPEDLDALERAVDAILRAVPENASSALRACRLCDRQRCASCPMDDFGDLPKRTARRGQEDARDHSPGPGR